MATWSGLWNNVWQTPYDGGNQKYTAVERTINRAFAGPRGGRRARAVVKALLGAAPGEAYSETVKQIAPIAQFSWGGGARAVNTVTLASGTTTSGDDTYYTNLLDAEFQPNPYPVEKSGYPQGGALNRIA